jgi:hypothetical protein
LRTRIEHISTDEIKGTRCWLEYDITRDNPIHEATIAMRRAVVSWTIQYGVAGLLNTKYGDHEQLNINIAFTTDEVIVEVTAPALKRA